MVNQKDIAESLNLSKSLVSKVLSGKLGTTKVKPETARAILALADALGYRPNEAGVSLATGRTGTIGVLVRRFGTPAGRLQDLLVDGISEEAAKCRQKLILMFYNTETQSRCFDLLSDTTRADGLIFAGAIPQMVKVNMAGVKHMPIVAAYGKPGYASIPRIYVDNARIIHLATRHLVERGCRRIARINTWTIRHEGYLLAMREAGLPIDRNLIFTTEDFGHRQGEKAIEHLLDTHQSFDGLVADSDEQAAGAINALLRRGLQVPQDVKVTGVDNSPFCEYCSCPLSSVNQNVFEMGRLALKVLMRRIESPDRPCEDVMVEPTLIQRRSTEA